MQPSGAADDLPPPLPPRRSKRRQPDRYGALLALIILDCIVLFAGALERFGRWSPLVLVVATVVFGVRTSRVTGPVVVVTQVAAAVLLLLAAIGEGIDSEWVLGWAMIIGALALGTLTVVILTRILRHDRVTRQTILGAICVYVLIGLMFAFAEYGISRVSGNAFFVQEAMAPFANHLYFSFVTLTTLGFGDLTPATDLGKGLVSFEALLGQVFLVTLVARLVSLYD
jgi:hypothetical protein